MYSAVYEELFTSLSDHPQNLGGRSKVAGRRGQMGKVAAYLRPGSVFLELGCGDAQLVFEVAGRVSIALGLDVTDVLIDFDRAPSNFKFLKTAGVNIPLATGSVDLAYSNQLMEHLHPDDAVDQLKEIYRVLKPGGLYICITPSRVTGPHDISRYFDYEATCFHLKEYDYITLRRLFFAAGFVKFFGRISMRGHQFRIPYLVARILEAAMLMLPLNFRARVALFRSVELVMGLDVIGVK